MTSSLEQRKAKNIFYKGFQHFHTEEVFSLLKFSFDVSLKSALP